ncbi:hypothetical protein SPRG_02831 [Saprolegnia parasitica CBS 223.65]|uniref:Uncharacterized protein n=1 Tax=Saprolegnia parasitica (strain CBS 223.65) TaxID=695850 RepID=A0A067CPD0_SAPPC|nr:hypothetical protein SPRG_02831 [Saprolegnia parasitica CBS 223.65]KDO32353.1 hypothetical protein SPRG_02831 [Saprolegnia parasitica CBS 223.65]|eukprot:XP_012196808.1 hypothetical protein SPRG_02831 [Saprolegnia parasitica CBS 223.65]
MHHVYVYGPRTAPPPSATCFNVTSKSKVPWTQAFSPFFSVLSTSRRFQTRRCYTKLYACHGDDVDAYWAWATNGFANPRAVRFPMGRGAKPLFSYWHGEPLGYIEARVRIYAPLYADAVETYAATELATLREALRHGDIALFDYDGYRHDTAGLSLEDVLYSPKRKMGHAFVLAMMLTEQRVWESEHFDSKKVRE